MAFVLLITAMLARGLVPSGFMPDSSSLVTVCLAGGTGLQTIWINPLTGEWVEVDHEETASQCPWALAASDAVLAFEPSVSIHGLPHCALRSFDSTACLGSFLTSLPPARGPPLA